MSFKYKIKTVLEYQLVDLSQLGFYQVLKAQEPFSYIYLYIFFKLQLSLMKLHTLVVFVDLLIIRITSSHFHYLDDPLDCTCFNKTFIRCFNEVLVTESMYKSCFVSDENSKLNIIGFNVLYSIIIDRDVKIEEIEFTESFMDSFPAEIMRIKSLRKLSIIDALFTYVNFDELKELNKLYYLDLSNNTINKCENFDNFQLKTLLTLNMSGNRLSVLDDQVFSAFPNLLWLSLAYNNITEITNDAFSKTVNVTYLDLSHNKIKTLNNSLMTLRQLQDLHLDNNHIKVLKENDFPFRQLKSLTLNHNNIEEMDYNVFFELFELKSINLSYNIIESIETQMFNYCLNLTSLDISYNNIKYIEVNCFKNNNFSEFFIQGNKLEIPLQKGIFNGLTDVKTLNLSHQNIGSIESLAFEGATSIKQLNLSCNHLELLSLDSFKYLNQLEILDLSANLLYNIVFNIEHLQNLQWISLRNNKLKYINTGMFNNFANLNYLDLSNNHINSIHNIVTNEQYNYMQNTVSNLREILLNNNSLKTENLSGGCFNNLTNVVFLDLSYNLLTFLKNSTFDGMISIRKLNISNCKINHLEYNVFENVSKLEIIDLSHNSITNLQINSDNLKSLSILILSHNFITSIAVSTIEPLININKLLIDNNQLQVLNFDVLQNKYYLNELRLAFDEHNSVYFNYTTLTGKYLNTLELTGIKGTNNSYQLSNVFVKYLYVHSCDIINISQLQLKLLNKLQSIVLTFNKITDIDKDIFRGQYVVEFIDLSSNDISFIQPGSFKDNKLVTKLNMSHNKLTDLGFGTFDGLNSLATLDISYNYIISIILIQMARISTVLHDIILDNNSIEEIVDLQDFQALQRKINLSIGNNQIPCKLLMTYSKFSFTSLTAINLDYHSDNIDGISCIKVSTDADNSNSSYSILSNLLPVLNNLSSNLQNLSTEMHKHLNQDYEIDKVFRNHLNETLTIDTSSEIPSNTHKVKHHSMSQLYESMKMENSNILQLLHSMKDEWTKVSIAVIFLCVVLGAVLLSTLLLALVKYVNCANICYRLKRVRYTEMVDSVELET